MSDVPGDTRAAPPPPPPGTTAVARRRNGAGTTALVLGVVSMVLTVLVLFAALALILGPLAIIFGIVGVNRARRGEADNRGQAVAGIVLGALSLVLVLVLGIRIAQLGAEHSNDFRRFGNCMREADDDQAFANCIRDIADELEEN